MIKYSLIIFLIFPLFANAVDVCSQQYLGLQGLITKSQEKRNQKISRIEKLINFIRDRKNIPDLVEVDRVAIERMILLDNFLYEGNTFLAGKRLRTLFRNFEINYHRTIVFNDLMREIKIGKQDDIESLLQTLLVKHKDDPFRTELLLELYKKRYTKYEKLYAGVMGQINEASEYIGRHFVDYTIAASHLEDIIASRACPAGCKKKLRKFIADLGVSGKNEKQQYPYIAKLRSPTIEEIKTVKYTFPRANEVALVTEALHELKALLRDVLSQPGSRKSFANFINWLAPAKLKKPARMVESALTDVAAMTNHFPMINRTLRSKKPIKKRFHRLRSQNVMFPNDELLVTFARRVDLRAKDGWNEFKAYAQNHDDDFYQRMVSSEELAKKKSELSNNFRRSPYRPIVFLLAATTAYSMYSVFYSTEAELTEITDSDNLLDHIELRENPENSEIIELHFKSEEASDAIIGAMEPIFEHIKAEQAKK